MEYAHWMMVAGAWLVVDLGFSGYMNGAAAEDNLHPETPSNSSAYRNLEAAFWRSFCSSDKFEVRGLMVVLLELLRLARPMRPTAVLATSGPHLTFLFKRDYP